MTPLRTSDRCLSGGLDISGTTIGQLELTQPEQKGAADQINPPPLFHFESALTTDKSRNPWTNTSRRRCRTRLAPDTDYPS